MTNRVSRSLAILLDQASRDLIIMSRVSELLSSSRDVKDRGERVVMMKECAKWSEPDSAQLEYSIIKGAIRKNHIHELRLRQVKKESGSCT